MDKSNAVICRVKQDALFSYQPPFNLLALIILKPMSYILTPRALHSLNVFLIKLTSFPTLVVIALYERYFAAGKRFRQSGKDAAQILFSSLPRQIKSMPLLEALLGSHASDLYDAIFDVEVTHEFDLFEDSDNDLPALRSFASSPRFTGQHRRAASLPREGSPRRSPTRLHGSALSPLGIPSGSDDIGHEENRSPLARLFVPPRRTSEKELKHIVNMEASVKRVEALLDDIGELPIGRLKDEMKELQVSPFLDSWLCPECNNYWIGAPSKD
jgi:hypothetical protein